MYAYSQLPPGIAPPCSCMSSQRAAATAELTRGSRSAFAAAGDRPSSRDTLLARAIAGLNMRRRRPLDFLN